MEYKIKKDKYFNSRDGIAHFVKIYCSRCDTYVLTYQKDGHGALIRMYMDRVVEPAIPYAPLKCRSCGELLAVPMVYKKEKRGALRINRGKVRVVKQM